MSEAMSNLEQIRQRSIELTKNSGDIDKLAKAADICKLEGETRRQVAELETLSRKERTETIRFYISVVAPTLSAFAILGAFVFQTLQFKKSMEIQQQTVAVQKETVEVQKKAAENQRAATENDQWREATKTFTQGCTLAHGFAAVALLKAFLAEGAHQEEARSMAVHILGNVIYEDIFSDLFQATFVTKDADTEIDDKTWTKIQDATKISKNLKYAYFHWNNNSLVKFGDKGPRPSENIPALPTPQPGLEEQNPEYIKSQLIIEVDLVGRFLVAHLRLPRDKEKYKIDLTDAALWDCDFSGMDLHNATLKSIYFYNVILEDADLSGVTEFESSAWENSAWWRAKIISPELLKYLKDHYAFNKTIKYTGATTATMGEYNTDVSRLEKLINNTQ